MAPLFIWDRRFKGFVVTSDGAAKRILYDGGWSNPKDNDFHPLASLESCDGDDAIRLDRRFNPNRFHSFYCTAVNAYFFFATRRNVCATSFSIDKIALGLFVDENRKT